jgi:hypothetical protein
MPSETSSSGGGLRPKPSTRSSIRHSLNLASMGKALADVMNKDGRDADKSSKKAKDNSSRRSSAINLKPVATPRTSMGDTKAPALAPKRVGTPDSKTITRRRASIVAQKSSSDERPAKLADSAPPQTTGVTRSSSIHPRNPATSSVLPKYRPKSVLMEAAKKPPSPARAGTRRRLSSSDDEKDDRKEQRKPDTLRSPPEKVAARPISPLPHRAAFKVNLTSAINVSPATPPLKVKPATPSSSKTSPARPTKTIKTASSISATQSAIPRPPSASSSSSSFTPRTPKSPSSKNALGYRRPGREKGTQESSPMRGSPRQALPESPYSRHSRTGSKAIPTAEPTPVGNMSHISEVNSEDSYEADDVELLLAPVASLAAPTPAMPRIQTSRTRQLLGPQTPTRTSSNLLPTRANLSYLSPLPPDSDSSPSRRPSQRQPGSDRAARGSILSWEQLATEASRTLGEDEIDSMLSEIPAPFRSRAGSPTPSPMSLDVPESPCLSALNSPGAYGSISQVLLPDVTPSPAVHHHSSQRYDNLTTEMPIVDAAIVTLLRLQLASAENTAKERLFRLQSMEEEIHNLKEARLREAEELTQQVAYLEDQMRGNIEARERSDEERAAYTASLEDHLRQAQAFRDQAVEEAVAKTQESARLSRDAALRSRHQKWEGACAARVAATEWTSVRDLAESELSIVKGDREILLVLLAELDHAQRQIIRIDG